MLQINIDEIVVSSGLAEEQTDNIIKEFRKETRKIMAKLSEQITQLTAQNEQNKADMANFRQVVGEEATEIKDKVDALDAQIAQLRAELEAATADNPAIAAVIADMEANSADLRAAADSVEALSEDQAEEPTEPTDPEVPTEPTEPEAPVEEPTEPEVPVDTGDGTGDSDTGMDDTATPEEPADGTTTDGPDVTVDDDGFVDGTGEAGEASEDGSR